jgi:UDP-glucose 4-epimerase
MEKDLVTQNAVLFNFNYYYQTAEKVRESNELVLTYYRQNVTELDQMLNNTQNTCVENQMIARPARFLVTCINCNDQYTRIV